MIKIKIVELLTFNSTFTTRRTQIHGNSKSPRTRKVEGQKYVLVFPFPLISYYIIMHLASPTGESCFRSTFCLDFKSAPLDASRSNMIS